MAAAEDKRALILAAAVRVFAKQGYEATRVGDIAKEAGVAYGLVYHYFGSKEAVLEAVFREAGGGRLAAGGGASLTGSSTTTSGRRRRCSKPSSGRRGGGCSPPSAWPRTPARTPPSSCRSSSRSCFASGATIR